MIRAAVLTVIVVASAIACSYPLPPYVILGIGFDSVEPPGAVEIDYYNSSTAAVLCVKGSFVLYDLDGVPVPAVGSNVVRFEHSEVIESEVSSVIRVPLENFIITAASSGYLVDQLCVDEVQFADGRVWRDPLRLYASGPAECRP